MCDYEPPIFYLSNIVKARKQHKCCECGSRIELTQQYEKVTGKWEHLISTYKTCLPCLNIRNAMLKLDDDACFGHTSLYEDTQNSLDYLEPKDK